MRRRKTTKTTTTKTTMRRSWTKPTLAALQSRRLFPRFSHPSICPIAPSNLKRRTSCNAESHLKILKKQPKIIAKRHVVKFKKRPTRTMKKTTKIMNTTTRRRMMECIIFYFWTAWMDKRQLKMITTKKATMPNATAMTKNCLCAKHTKPWMFRQYSPTKRRRRQRKTRRRMPKTPTGKPSQPTRTKWN